MTLGALVPADLLPRLRGPGVCVATGPFSLHVQIAAAQAAEAFGVLYRDYPLLPDGTIPLARVALSQPVGPRRWVRPFVECTIDDEYPFDPLPLGHAFPLLEWGMNWCVATRAHRYLMLHSAVVEREGAAMLLPAWTGSGKTTLCAALIHRGWRYFSDEFAMVRLSDGLLAPVPRPLPLKNESVGVIRAFAPEAVLGPVFRGTRKGDIAHVRPPEESVRRAGEAARPAWVVFPSYQPGAALRLTPLPRSRSFLKMAGNSFNFQVMGAPAWHALVGLVDSCDSYTLAYSDLEEAVECLGDLAGARGRLRL